MGFDDSMNKRVLNLLVVVRYYLNNSYNESYLSLIALILPVNFIYFVFSLYVVVFTQNL